MCPGKRLPILFAFLFPLLIFYLHQPPIFPTAPCEPLKPLSRLQDLAEVWRQSEQICGEIGASLRTLYQVEQEEAGRLVLPKPLLEGGLKYDYTKIGAQLSSPHAESARAVTGSTEKVSHWCPKIWIFGPTTANLAQNWHFGPNISIFGPFDLMPDQKTMRTSCLGGFLLCWYNCQLKKYHFPCQKM